MLTIGQKVPKGLKGTLVTFETDKESAPTEAALDSLLKKSTVVLYFYPKDMTPGCTAEAKDFQANLKALESLQVTVLGCSRDTVKSHCKFIDKHGLTFPLLADTSEKITEAFGVWSEKKLYGKTYMGITRSTFIIEDGVIIQAYPKVKVKEHIKEIIEFFQTRKSPK